MAAFTKIGIIGNIDVGLAVLSMMFRAYGKEEITNDLAIEYVAGLNNIPFIHKPTDIKPFKLEDIPERGFVIERYYDIPEISAKAELDEIYIPEVDKKLLNRSYKKKMSKHQTRVPKWIPRIRGNC